MFPRAAFFLLLLVVVSHQQSSTSSPSSAPAAPSSSSGTPVASASAQSASSPGSRTLGTRRKVKGIPNFGEVSPNLYRGAQPSELGLKELKKMGVDIVVDLRGGHSQSEDEAVTKLGMKFVSIPSHCPFPHDEPFAKFIEVFRDHPGKKVFVHCRLGDDRTGMAVAAYRMSEQGWSADEAMKEMKEFGFTGVHHTICPGLAEYEQSFPERLKTGKAFKEVRSK